MTDEAQPKKPPRYQQIADELRAAITRGDYKPGDRLPSEADIRATHQVARGTARDALAVLQAQGLTESRRGSGVYVRSFRMIERDAADRVSRRRWGAGRSIWEADAAGRDHHSDTEVTEIEAPESIAGTLGIALGSRVWRRSRLHSMEGRIVQRSTSYLPAWLVAGSPITRPNSGPGGVYARLDEMGHGPERFREEVRARMPLADEARVLNIAGSTPVLVIWRTAYDTDDHPVEVNEMVLDSNNYLLKYDFTP